jgi:hypothetical protein
MDPAQLHGIAERTAAKLLERYEGQIPEEKVHNAVLEAANQFEEARVTSFLPVLIERAAKKSVLSMLH